jgi:hypothetical protein
MKMNSLKQGVIYTILLTVISTVLFAAGCVGGVSQDEYQRVANDLSTARADLVTANNNLESLRTQTAKIGAYLDVMNRCIDVWRLLAGQSSQYGYAKGEVGKWATDMDSKVNAINDTSLTALWKSFGSAQPGSPDQTKKGVAMMSYLMDKMKELSTR